MKKIIFFTIAFVFLLTGFFALARESEIIYPNIPGAQSPQEFIGSVEENEAFPLFLKYFYHFIVYSSGLICLGVMIYGGVGYLLSFGSAVKMKDALDRVTVGFIGVIIILSSFTMAKTIDPNLVTFDLEKINAPEVAEIEIADIEIDSFTFYEVPIGGLIDEVKEKAEIADTKAYYLLQEAKKLQNYNSCLRDISDQCKCENLKGECESGGSPPGSFCYEGACEGDPCDKLINPFMCSPYGIPIIGANPSRARESIEVMNGKIAAQEAVVESKKLETAMAKAQLDWSNLRLKLAEALLRASIGLTSNLDTIASMEEVIIKKLWIYEDFSVVTDDGRVVKNDPATLFIQKQGNEQVIAEVQSLLTAPPPMIGGIFCDVLDGSAPVPPNINENIKKWALQAEEKTGVRASLLIALMYHESGLQRFVGSGRYPDSFCRTIVDDKAAFRTIWNDVKGMYGSTYSITTIPVSGAGPIDGVNHCGGAMGPAQAMPYEWLMHKSTLQGLTGRSTVSPWEYEEAFLFAGLHLNIKSGANSKNCGDEMKSIIGYFGSALHANFACSVINVSNSIANEFSWDKCEGAIGTGGNSGEPSQPPSPGEWSHPVRGIPLSNGGEFGNGHAGWDYKAGVGTLVYPSKPGKVIFSGWNNQGYGNLVKVDHGDGYISFYGHLSKMFVFAGDQVGKNDQLGETGNTGNSTGPHLHFEIREGTWRAVDPAYFLSYP